MKFCKCLILFLLFILVNGKLVPFRAKNVETLVIFLFTENSTENVGSYVKYFSYLASLTDIKKDYADNFRLNLFFGNYEATDILQISDASILRHPLLNRENISAEAYIPNFNKATQCNQIFLCAIIHDFFKIPRDFSTKINFLIISDICLHQSIFEEFYKNDKERLFTSTFLVSSAAFVTFRFIFLIKFFRNQDICDVNSTMINNYFVPPPDFDIAKCNDRLSLYNHSIFRDSSNTENHILIRVKKENLNISIKFIADYYNDATNCDLEAPPKDKRKDIYFITLNVKDRNIFEYKEITMTFSDLDLTNSNLSTEKYLEWKLNYILNNAKSLFLESLIFKYDTRIQEHLSIHESSSQHVIVFTDDANVGSYMRIGIYKPNGTVDHILYTTSPTEMEIQVNRINEVIFHKMVPKNPENASSRNICERLKQYGLTPHPKSLHPVEMLAIGVGIIIVLIIGNMVYRIFKKNPISAFMETYEFKNKEELSKECNKLQLGKKDFKINFNVVKGRGAFSTVYKAELKRSLIPNLSLKSMTNDNNTSEYCIVAAKILSNYEEEEMFNVIGEIQAVQKLGSHEKICTLLRWSTHSGAPCLFFELMEMDLQSYLISLRNKSNNLLTKDELVLSLTDTGDHFNIPEFDRKQQLIFMQILWQISQGLEYIASKRIVHRDVAARNILLSRYNNTETYIAKITDFGLCILLEKDTNIFRAPEYKKLPYKWLAIESLVDRIFSQASDIWAFGILMMEIYTCAGILYPGIGSNEIVYFLKNDKRMEKPKNMSQEMYDLVSVCWDKNPYSRKTFSQLNLDLKQILRQLSSNNDDYKDYWQMNDKISICSKISLK